MNPLLTHFKMSSSKLPFHLHPLDFELQSATLEDLSSEQLGPSSSRTHIIYLSKRNLTYATVALIQFHPFCTEELRGQVSLTLLIPQARTLLFQLSSITELAMDMSYPRPRCFSGAEETEIYIYWKTAPSKTARPAQASASHA